MVNTYNLYKNISLFYKHKEIRLITVSCELLYKLQGILSRILVPKCYIFDDP